MTARPSTQTRGWVEPILRAAPASSNAPRTATRLRSGSVSTQQSKCAGRRARRPTSPATITLWVFAVPNADKVFARGSFGGAVEMVDEGWSFYKVEIQVEPGSSHHYVFSIPTSPGAPELVSRPPRGSSCDFDGEANYGFVAPSTCGGVLSLPAYEWQNGCACAGC